LVYNDWVWKERNTLELEQFVKFSNNQDILHIPCSYLNNFASIGAIVPLASFRNLVDMPSIPLESDEMKCF